MKLYLSGGITGVENAEILFHYWNMRLGDKYRMYNPFSETPKQSTWFAYMRADIKALMNCDGVALLPLWWLSRGSRIEALLAYLLGIPVHGVKYWERKKTFPEVSSGRLFETFSVKPDDILERKK